MKYGNEKDNIKYEAITFNWSDYFYLFRSQKLCFCFTKGCQGDKKSKSRKDLLDKIYEIGERKIQKELSIEKILIELR